MKIAEISIQGMHNVEDKTYTLSDLNYLFGNNGAGKSTVMQALQLAILGYIPGTDKNKTAIFRHANGKIMRVSVKFDTGDIISRTYKNVGTAIQADISNTIDPEQILADIELPIFNFNEFSDMTANKLKDWFINFLPDYNMPFDWIKELADVAPQITKENLTASLGAVSETINAPISLLEKARELNTICKSNVSIYKNEVSRLTSTMQSLVHYDDFDTALSEADVNEYIRINDMVLQDVRRKMSVYKQNENAIKTLAEIKNRIGCSSSEDFDKRITELEAKASEWQIKASESEAEMKSLSEKIANLKAEIHAEDKILSSNGICPFTNSACHDMQTNIESAKIHVEACNTELKELNLKYTEVSAENKTANQQAQIIRTSISSISNDRKLFETLSATVDESLANESLTDLINKETELVNDINAKRDIIVKIKANQQYDSLKATISKDIFNAEELLELNKAWDKFTGVNGIQSKIMEAPFELFSDSITKYLVKFFGDATLKAAFKVGEKANSFSFGLKRNGAYFDFDLLSSGEKCMYTLSLLLAIVENAKSELKLVMIDDLLDHLDDNRISDVFTTLYNCTDTQVLLAGVKPCTHENADNFVIRI